MTNHATNSMTKSYIPEMKKGILLTNKTLTKTHQPPEMGGISATVSPFFKPITSPTGTYSSFTARVRLSSFVTKGASLGY
mmetsp:Transcript_5924/g.7492  ORF Transcript_5924/g.7492 Transcript_5924/m.7492 type:complete len:80 (-) Transcript_5924:291-530(-)